MGPVAQPVFKTGAAWQPHARSVRLRRRSAKRKTGLSQAAPHDGSSELWLELWTAELVELAERSALHTEAGAGVDERRRQRRAHEIATLGPRAEQPYVGRQ